jgi:ABC-type nitrate/sulfonate/bicarbonate transport system substrate-binding protein
VRSTFNGLATSDAMIAKHPDTVMKFVRATVKGLIFIRDDRDDAIALFARYMKTTPDKVAGEYDFLHGLMASGGVIPPDLQAAEIALRGEMMDLPAATRPTADAVFDFSWAERADAELQRAG